MKLSNVFRPTLHHDVDSGRVSSKGAPPCIDIYGTHKIRIIMGGEGIVGHRGAFDGELYGRVMKTHVRIQRIRERIYRRVNANRRPEYGDTTTNAPETVM